MGFGLATLGGAASSDIDSVGIVDVPLPFTAAGTTIGGSAAPWNPTWSVSAGWKPRPFCVRTWTMTGPGSSSAWAKVESSALMSWPGTRPMYVIPRSSKSRPAWAKFTTEWRSRWLSSRTVGPTTGICPTSESYFFLLDCHVPRELDLAQIRREPADRRADRHLVVVQDDQQLRLPLADVVERLEAEAAGDGRVADDHRDPLQPMAEVAGRRQALPDRQAGPGVSAVEDIVLGLAAAREATDAADLAERPEPLEPAGQQLVRVGLVAGVPDDPVARRFEEPVQGDRELDDPEGAAEVSAGRRDGRDDGLADLGGELIELRFGQATEVGGAMESREDRHASLAPGVVGASLARVGLAPEGTDRWIAVT